MAENRYLHLAPGASLPSIERPYKVILVVDEPAGSAGRTRLCDALLRSGCAYVFACGRESAAWVEEIDRLSAPLIDDPRFGAEVAMAADLGAGELRDAFAAAQRLQNPMLRTERVVMIHVAERPREALLSEASGVTTPAASADPADAVYLHLPPGAEPPSLAAIAPYKALVIVEDDGDVAWRTHICDWLMHGGATFILTYERGMPRWDIPLNRIELEMLETEKVSGRDVPKIMDYSGEPLPEAFEYFAHADHYLTKARTRVIVHVARQPREAEILEGFRRGRSG